MENNLDFIKEDDFFEILGSQDGYLIEWLETQNENKFQATCVDYESELIWTDNCPYAISFDDIEVIERGV